jgi:hypothetical protein
MPMPESFNFLRIDSSAATTDSVTRRPGDDVIGRLLRQHPHARVTRRDLSEPVAFIDAGWVYANLADPAQRVDWQRATLSASDRLVTERDVADVIVQTAPVYNFPVPAALRAWLDQVCRTRLTFRSTGHAPQGLLRDRPVPGADERRHAVRQSGRFRQRLPAPHLRLAGHPGRAHGAGGTHRSWHGASEHVVHDMIDRWLPPSTGMEQASLQRITA